MATNSSSLEVQPMAIGEMFGPPLVGIMISCMLFGLVQCGISACSILRVIQNRLWVKSYVATLLLLDLVGMIFAIWWIYDLLVTNFAQYQALFIVTFRLAIHPVLVGLQVLTEKLWLCIPLFFGCLVSMGCTIGLTIYITIHTDITGFYDPAPHTMGAIWLATTAFVDVCITTILSFYLRQRKVGIMRTDHILNRIIAATVQNGLVTSACAVVELAAFLGLPHSGLHMAFVFLLPKVYCNAVMSSLNARQREGRNSIFTAPATVEFVSNQNHGVPPSMPRFAVSVSTTTETHEMGDIKFDRNQSTATVGTAEVKAAASGLADTEAR